MIKSLILFLVSASFVLSGCSYNVTKGEFEEKEKYYERVNKLCMDKDSCIISTIDQKTYNVHKIKIGKDSIIFYNFRSNSIHKLASNDVSKIRFKGTGSSIFEGFLFGGVSRGVIGNIISNPPSPGMEKAVTVLGGFLLGGITGILVSILYPAYTVIDFNF